MDLSIREMKGCCEIVCEALFLELAEEGKLIGDGIIIKPAAQRYAGALDPVGRIGEKRLGSEEIVGCLAQFDRLAATPDIAAASNIGMQHRHEDGCPFQGNAGASQPAAQLLH